MIIRRKHIRQLTRNLLSSLGIQDAPINAEQIAKLQNAEVRRQMVQGDVSGFLYRDNVNGLAIIGVNSSHPDTRQRFTIAHELGHFLLHAGQEMHVDRQFTVKLRSGVSSEGVDTDEVEANLFAAELLMPAEFLEKDITFLRMMDLLDEQHVKGLADKYRVSSQALTIRLGYLGYIQL